MVMLKDIALFSAPNNFVDSSLWQNKLVQPVLLCAVRQAIGRQCRWQGPCVPAGAAQGSVREGNWAHKLRAASVP